MADLTDPAEAFDALNEEIGGLADADKLELGHAAIALVVARTKKGIAADGKKFTAYKPEYDKVRIKAGLRTDPPDLVRSGHMLGGMQPLVTGKDEVTVTFPSDLEAKKAGRNNETREFLDIRQSRELDFLADVASEAMSRRAEKKLR